MCSNFTCQLVNLTPPSDIPFENTTSAAEKKACDKQIKIELNLESDTDFQSFLLPLEQDLTKSSKGYASLLTTIPNKDERSVVYKNKLEESKVIQSSNEKMSNDYYCNKHLHDNSSCSSGDNSSTSNSDNLYYESYTQFIHNALDNIKIGTTGESNCFKSHVKTIHCSQNFHNSGYTIHRKENMYLEKCIKTACNFSVSLSNSSRFINNQSDDSDNSESSKSDSFSNGCDNSQNCDDDSSSDDSDNSESSKSNSFSNGCNNSQNCDDDSSSDDSIIFCDEVVKNKAWCSSIEIDQAFAATINSESSDTDNDSLEESEKSTSAYCSEDFEFGLLDLKSRNMALQNDLHNQIVFKSEGYINACFEEDHDDFLIEKPNVIKSINENWNNIMKNVSGEPHESKRVSFVPLPDLVSVFSYEPEEDDYHYSLYVLDQLRFQNRIKDFEHIIAPYLTSEHRANICHRNCLRD